MDHTIEHIPDLDVLVTPATADDVLNAIRAQVGSGRRFLIAAHNLHSSFLYHSDDEFRRLYDEEADLIVIDGQPVRWLLNRVGGALSEEYRIGSVDWLTKISPELGLGRIAIVGGGEEANSITTQRIADATGAVVRGFPCDPLTPEREDQVIASLGELAPHLVLVGLGMPLQERFYLRNRDRLPVGVHALVGGAIDQLAGVQKRAPGFLGRMGLEWLWRLALSPSRLGHRYLIEPAQLATLRLRQRQARENALYASMPLHR
ncbi:MAG: WecB/TagA/CpsF family glycosyltransferase [Propionibacteriaceae bacterium]|jgi:N-acetylglucosaminyldiphosphoundecaprenol N-acetyl-beta-D-mannosaminyltransferase|nr:WecB/TagA/CpsF family glycosyltransferase [Propionibacteriaceae bacterium]